MGGCRAAPRHVVRKDGGLHAGTRHVYTHHVPASQEVYEYVTPDWSLSDAAVTQPRGAQYVDIGVCGFRDQKQNDDFQISELIARHHHHPALHVSCKCPSKMACCYTHPKTWSFSGTSPSLKVKSAWIWTRTTSVMRWRRWNSATRWCQKIIFLRRIHEFMEKVASIIPCP